MNRPHIQYRWMEPDEVVKIGDIDRTERIRAGYKQTEGELQRMDVHWDSPAWRHEGSGEHTVAAIVEFCRDHLNKNGRLFGAFAGDKLVGVGLIQQNIAAGMAQLAFLHVSDHYRRLGIGRRITEELFREAKTAGATTMYVSATPSGSAVGFYLNQGFQPTDSPIPELFALEPDDIHMIMEI